MIVNTTTCGAHKNVKDIYKTFVNVLSWATLEFRFFLQYFFLLSVILILAISEKSMMAIKINNLFPKKNVGREKNVSPERNFGTERNFGS